MATNVVFFGSHDIAIPLLDFMLHDDRINVVGIVSQPDKPKGRGQSVQKTIISQYANEHNIPLLTPVRPDAATIEWLRDLHCELIFVMAYGHILSNDILSFPKLGIYNLHASILPKYRGASPIETAISCGEKTTGISLMNIVAEMDAGNIIDTMEVSIDDDDNCSDVTQKLSNISPKIVERNIDAICQNAVISYKQDHNDATFTRKLTKSDGILDFNQPAQILKNRARALSPHIGAYIEYNGITLRIDDVHVEHAQSVESPGTIIETSNVLKISTIDGILSIERIQKPGGKMMSFRDFINGFNMPIGSSVTSHIMQDLVVQKK